MKIFIILLSTGLVFNTYAQKNISVYNNTPYLEKDGFNYYPNTIGYTFSHDQAFYKAKKIKTVENIEYKSSNKGEQLKEIHVLDKEGRIIETKKTSLKNVVVRDSKYIYDNRGNIEQILTTNQKGKTSKINYTYSDSNLIASIIFTHDNKLVRSTHYKYRKDGRIISQEDVNEKGVYRAHKIKYNQDGVVVSKMAFVKDKENPKTTLVYKYHPDGSKETITYLKKGKEKHKWNYDCKPEGELIRSASKHNSTYCVKEEFEPNGNRIVWTNLLDQNGVLTKVKETYTSDSTLLSIQYIDYKTSSVYFEKIIKPEGGHKSIHYNKDGTSELWTESFLNENRKLVKWTDYKKNHTSLYHYDKNLKTSIINITKYGTNVTEINYEYY